MNRSPVVLLVGLVGSLLIPGSPALAGNLCSFDADSHTVTAHVGDQEQQILDIFRENEEIRVRDADCGEATVTNTDRVVVDGTSSEVRVRINLRSGPFRPGHTEEEGDSDEIEFELDLTNNDDLAVIAGGSSEEIRMGGGAPEEVGFRVNLNPGEADGVDPDVRTSNMQPDAGLYGEPSGGPYGLDASGGAGTGAATPVGVILSGGDDNDVLRGGLGRDDLWGGFGPDTEFGGPGRDKVEGGNGDDRLLGGGGADYVRDLSGDDRLEGGSGPDIMNGGHDDDTLLGGSGVDRMHGARERDDLRGGRGNDLLWGGRDADLLAGQEGSDFCDGGDGNDGYSSCETQP